MMDETNSQSGEMTIDLSDLINVGEDADNDDGCRACEEAHAQRRLDEREEANRRLRISCIQSAHMIIGGTDVDALIVGARKIHAFASGTETACVTPLRAI